MIRHLPPATDSRLPVSSRQPRGAVRAVARAKPFGLTLAGLTLVICLLHLAGLDGDHDWGDDFAAYLTNARNIAQRQPYGETGYLYNPQYPTLGPGTTPPGFPLLLAPLVAAGASLAVFKLVGVAALAGVLMATGYLARRALPPTLALTAVTIVGLHPLVWRLTNQIMSDLPFTAWFLLSLVLALQLPPPGRPVATGRVLGLGAAMWAAWLTRALGFVVPLALLIFDLARYRTVRRSTLMALGVAGGLVLVSLLVVPSDPTAPDRLPASLAEIGGNVQELGWRAASLWALPGPLYISLLATLGIFGMAAWGMFTRWRQGGSVVEHAAIWYVAAVSLLAANVHTRYWLPVLPLLVGYALLGMRQLYRARPTWGMSAAVGGLALIGVSYTVPLLAAQSPAAAGVGSPHAQAMFAYIRAQTEPDDLIIFRKPRALHWFTGRRAAVWHQAPDEELLAHFDRLGADYVLTGPSAISADMAQLVRHHPQYFQPVHQAGEHILYRFLLPAGYH